MTAIDRDRARAAFKSYTDAYDATNPRIALKIEHTYHVAEACDAVAREQGWSSEDIDLAWLCGLLHDMGRFEQLRRWDTFKDAESMSHAALGIEVLFGENPADAPAVTSIRDFIDDPAEDELIRASIAYHSDFRLPAQLDERTRSFCDIVRDGDKIDIMRTIADSTVDTILKVDEKTFLGSRFSSPTLAAFDEHRCVARDERDEPADFLVGLICFMFELVYPASRALAREQDWSPQDIDLAWLCGLLHDMGRFEQLRRWDTFKDAESMSHAELGVEVLFGKNPADAPATTSIRDFIDDPAEDELIRASIAHHSDFRLPTELDTRTRNFCDIVRDGDKIDIMRTIADSTVDTILKVDEDTFLTSHFSVPTLAAFDEHRCVARDERDEPADYLVGLIYV